VNILLITPYLPHYRSGHGGGLLVYELIQLLHGTCEITIVTFLTREEEPLLLDLRRQGIRVVAVPRQRGAPSSPIALVHFVRMRFNALVKGIIAGVPYSVAKYADATMMDALKSLMESQQFDILQVEYSQCLSDCARPRCCNPSGISAVSPRTKSPVPPFQISFILFVVAV
jgi:hypothetical protein